MTPEELREKVARAIHEAHSKRTSGVWPWENTSDHERDLRRAGADAALAVVREAMRELMMDALRYRYLREHCSDHYPMTHEQPAEWSIQWGFQQVNPSQAYGTFDGWIDADIARLDDEDRAALAASPLAEPSP